LSHAEGLRCDVDVIDGGGAFFTACSSCLFRGHGLQPAGKWT
jgi:hypothetical protein